jgi:hypothetical protein
MSCEEEPTTKAKRPDRSHKLKDRKNSDETVVKCCLKKLLLLEKDNKDNFVQLVKKRVIECSLKTFNASIALNLLVRKLITGVDDDTLVEVEFPEFWDVTFVRQLMLGTRGSVKPFSVIQELHDNHLDLLDTSRSFGDRNIYCSAAVKLATNIKNHLKTNFEATLKKALYKGYELNSEEGYEVQKAIYGWKGKRNRDVTKQIDTDKVARLIKYYRRLLGLQNTQTIGKLWFKQEDNLSAMLKLFIQTNQRLEALGEKLISILPICRIKNHFITIDSFTLTGILKDVGLLKKDANNTLESAELWSTVLNISKIQGIGKRFTGTIDTDGLIINVHFQRPKRTAISEPDQISLNGKRILGIDSGRSNIMTVVEEQSPGVYKSYILTRKHYYSEAGMFRARERTNRWNSNVKSELKELSWYSPKSVRLEAFLDYMDVLSSVKDSLWSEYTKERWQAQRFRLYGGKKRVFARFLNRLGSPDNTVIAYGNAKFQPGGKGELSVPTSRAYKECSYRFKTVPIDEFRTSKINWTTQEVLDTVMKKNEKGKLVAVRGLLWCRSTSQSEGKFINRDTNAAINIQRCAALPTRPLIFQRNKATGKIVQRIGNVIRC